MLRLTSTGIEAESFLWSHIMQNRADGSAGGWPGGGKASEEHLIIAWNTLEFTILFRRLLQQRS